MDASGAGRERRELRDLERLAPPAGRMLALLLVLLVAIGAVVARTTYVQSVQNRTLTSYAKSQQHLTQQLPAVRGAILDRNGHELAVGEEAVTITATPWMIDEPAQVAAQLGDLLELRPAEQARLAARLDDDESGFAYVARQVPRDVADRVIEAEITGIDTVDEQRRFYPNGAVAGQLLGTVDIDNEGIAGLEMLYEGSLSGTPGEQVVVRDPAGTPIDVLELQPEQDGRDVRLTIDAIIQAEAERILAETVKSQGAKGGTAIVMDPTNGQVLAMASVPRVNPNKWGASTGRAQRMRAITDQYEPGSTFKVVAIAGALEERAVTPTTSFVLPPELEVADRKITDSHERGTIRLDTRGILVESSNIGTVMIARDYLKSDRFDAWTRRFGFGTATGIDFPGEIPGEMLDYEDWSGASIGNIPIGQGIAVTPLQMASAYATIANDGVRVQPHLRLRVGDEPEAAAPRERVLSVETAQQMQRMFGDVVNSENGTGRRAAIPGYQVAGKTGTAEVVENGTYAEGRYTASFVGFVPADNPRLVTIVVVDEPAGEAGGIVAAPAFRQITQTALDYLGIPPDGRV